MTWTFWFVVAWAGIGAIGILCVLASHWLEWQEQARQRRRLQLHQWRVEAERDDLRGAAMWKGYRK